MPPLRMGLSSELKVKVLKEARTRFLESKANALMDENEHNLVWECILKHSDDIKIEDQVERRV